MPKTPKWHKVFLNFTCALSLSSWAFLAKTCSVAEILIKMASASISSCCIAGKSSICFLSSAVTEKRNCKTIKCSFQLGCGKVSYFPKQKFRHSMSWVVQTMFAIIWQLRKQLLPWGLKCYLQCKMFLFSSAWTLFPKGSNYSKTFFYCRKIIVPSNCIY